MTFSSQSVVDRIERTFVATWFNQAPDAYPAGAPFEPGEPAVTLAEGAGAGNVKVFFCTPAGRIVHAAQGFHGTDTLLAGLDLAAELAAVAERDPDDLARRHAARRAALWREVERLQVAPPTWEAVDEAALGATARELERLAVLLDDHDLAIPRLLQDPAPFMTNDRGFT